MVPNDPNHRMHELLKRYAQKRQAEAQPPFELGAAQRRALQTEVDRVFNHGAGERESGGYPLGLFWRRLMWGTALTAVLFVAAGLWMRFEDSSESRLAEQAPTNLAFFAQDKPQEKARSAETSGLPERLRQFELGASGKSIPGRTAGAAPRSPEELAKLTVRSKEAERLNLALAPRPEVEQESKTLRDQLGTPLAAAANRPQASQTRELSEQINPAPVTPPLAQAKDQAAPASQPWPQADGLQTESTLTASASPAAKAPLLAPQKTYYFGVANSQSLRFQQIDRRVRYRLNLNSPPPAPLLTNFEVQAPNPQVVRILDSDGSVYEGTREPLATQAVVVGSANSSPPAVQLVRGVATPSASSVAPQQGLPGLANASEDGSFTFRAVGTNMTLNQVVVFTGRFDPGPPNLVRADSNTMAGIRMNAPAPAQAPVANAQNATRGLQQKLSRQVTPSQVQGRIFGNASVGGKDEIRIEAQQVGP